jgi:hypothetical protein
MHGPASQGVRLPAVRDPGQPAGTAAGEVLRGGEQRGQGPGCRGLRLRPPAQRLPSRRPPTRLRRPGHVSPPPRELYLQNNQYPEVAIFYLAYSDRVSLPERKLYLPSSSSSSLPALPELRYNI